LAALVPAGDVTVAAARVGAGCASAATVCVTGVNALKVAAASCAAAAVVGGAREIALPLSRPFPAALFDLADEEDAAIATTVAFAMVTFFGATRGGATVVACAMSTSPLPWCGFGVAEADLVLFNVDAGVLDFGLGLLAALVVDTI
jgi:hypothetical protein